MARFLLLLGYLLWLHGAAAGADVGRTVQRTALEEVYLSQVGVREASGRNDGLQVRAYQVAAKVPVGGEWCAAFVCWCLRQAGIPAQQNGWAAAWFPRRRVIWHRNGLRVREPLPGDVIGYTFNPKKPGHINHVGFVHRWGSGNSVATVEGNTNAAGARTGNGVWKKWRLKSQVCAVSDWVSQ